MRGKKTLVGSLVVIAGCGSAAAPPDDDSNVERTQSPLLVSRDELYPWGQRTVDVCFSSGWGTDRERVQWAFERTWGRESAMAINDVGDCNSSNVSSTVKVRAWRGTDWFVDWNMCGLDVDHGDAAGTNRAVGVSLMGTGVEVPVCHFNSNPRAAARGFGFVLGFREELEREDRSTVPVCKVLPVATSTAGFEAVGPFDFGSVMNRCSPVISGPSVLTASEIDGVQKVYGHAQPLAVRDLGAGAASMFARGADNTLMENYGSGASSVWFSHGESLGGAPTVVKILGQPHVFVRLADGTLAQRWYTGSAWTWFNHGGGPALGIKGKPAAITEGAQVRVFVRGIDDRLYQYWWNGGVWAWSRVNEDVLLNSDPSVVSPSPGQYSVFASSGSALVELSWDGATWQMTNHTTPPVGAVTTIEGAPQAIATANGDMKVFVKGSDGSLFERFRQNGTWQWAGHGGLLRGAPAIEGPLSVWIRGSDDRLWQNFWNGSAWQWLKHDGVAITSSPSVKPPADQHVVYVRNGSGGIVERVWNGSSWVWANHPGNFVLP